MLLNQPLGLLAQPAEKPQTLGLLSPEVQQLFQGGLLGGRFQPGPNEGWSERLFGTSDPRDPRGRAMMALSTGLMQGKGLGGAFAAYNNAFDQHEDRMLKRATTEMLLGKNALELQGLLDTRKREQSIRAGLDRLSKEEKAGQSRAAMASLLDPQPVDQYGTAGVGGVPLFSMDGPQRFGNQPAGSYTPPTPQTSMPTRPQLPVPLNAGTAGAPMQPQGQQGQQGTQGLQSRFLKQAEVYAANGDFATANKLYEQAAKWMPEVHKIEVAMYQGQPVNVITMKDGRQQVSPFAPTPKTHWQDTGAEVRAIDEYTLGERGRFTKTPTFADRTAAGNLSVAQQNLGLTRDRLKLDQDRFNLEQNAPQYLNTDSGVIALPKRPGPGPITGQVVTGQGGQPLGVGAFPKLTERQANATQFATRMLDASRVVSEITKGGAPWPSTVARAGYDPQMPGWLPGGQMIAGATRGINNAIVPADAQRYYQAQQNWVSAGLRAESGAAITPSEMEAEIRKWWPQPGDSAAVIESKAQARKVAEEAMLVQAGPGREQALRIAREAAERAGKSGGNAEAQPLPDKPSAANLKAGASYRLKNGEVGTWDGSKFVVRGQ